MSKIIGVTVGTPLSLSRIKNEITPDIQKHENNKKNPHGVTKNQVGLGNVDNTSDMNKPVSTAQATAIADAKKAGTDAQTAANNAQTAANNAQTTANSAITAAGNALTESKNYTDSKHMSVQISVPASGWSASAPYTQSVSVSGLLATDQPHIGLVPNDNWEMALIQEENWGYVSRGVTENGSITFTCYEDKPEVNLPLQIEVNR